MKVVYFIFVSAGGRGGHFHSLNHISREINTSATVDAQIITFGREKSEVIVNNPLFARHIYFTKSNFISCYI